MIKAKVGIAGGAGYVGGETIRLLLNHPNCELIQVLSRSQVGKPLSTLHPDLLGMTALEFESELSPNLDILFLCMGHGRSREFFDDVTIKNDCLVVDLSRDFRLKEPGNKFIYGLCELNKAAIQNSQKIANPGCFATCIQLGLLPLASEQAIHSDIHIAAVTGSTGAGQKPLKTTHHAWRNNNISVYKAFTHQHLDEIKQSLLQLQPAMSNDINFIPMRGSFTRGIFANIYLESSMPEKEAIEKYQSYYRDSPFVHLSESPINVKHVVNTNNAQIHISKHKSKLRIETAIDNLLKGASGQAVQNMNLAMGWPEDQGLKLKPSSF